MKRVCVLFLFIFVSSVEVFCKTLGVGVLLDKSEVSSGMEKKLEKELNLNFAGTNYEPKILKTYVVENNNFKEELSKLEKNPEINGIFVLTYEIPQNLKLKSKNKFYSFPFGFLKENNLLKYKNVNYITGKFNVQEDVKLLKELKPMKKLGVFVPTLNNSEEKIAGIKKLFKKENMPVEIITENTSEENMRNILKTVDGLYLISYGQYGAKPLALANQMKLPTFTIDFSSALNKKSLMGYDLRSEIDRRLRGGALSYMLYKTKNKRNLIGEIGDIKKTIFYNMDIGNEIDCYPSLLFLQNIQELNKNEEKKQYLGFKEAINRALIANNSLLSARNTMESFIYNVGVANSKRLPQLSLNAQYNRLDKDITSIPMNKPENSVNSYVKLSQVIFNDQINANVYIQKQQLKNSQAAYEQAKKDTIYYVASTYLNILQLNAQLKIQESNYKVVKESLNVARVNYKVGASGAQDVYRLESSLSSALSNIAEVKGQIKMAEASLNRLLNYPIDNSYTYENFNKISQDFVMGKDFLKKYAYGSSGTNKLLNFLINGAVENSENLENVENNINIKKREYTAAGRERYIPSIEAFGQYNKNNIITPWGENSNVHGPSEYWQGGVAITLPLIQGGETIEQRKMIEKQIESLSYKKKELNNEIAQNVSQTFTKLLTDYIQSYTSEVSATSAEKNLKIVSNLYAAGNGTITDLLDAQNSTLAAQLNHVIANYNMFNSAVKLENLYGDYTITKTPLERQAIINKLESIMN